MDFFCQKRTRSDSQPKATLPVKRRASCPLTRQGTRVDRRQDRGSFLAGLFRARPPAGARRFPAPGLELGAEESVPLLGGSSEGQLGAMPGVSITASLLPAGLLDCSPQPEMSPA